MLHLQLAEAYVDIVANRSPFNSVLTSVIADLGRLKGLGTIPLTMNRAQATASLGLLRQQLDELRKAASINVTMERGRGFDRGLGGGLGSRGVGGAGLGMGLMQGLGVAGFAMSPAMMGGAMIGAGLKEAVGVAMDLQDTFIDLQRVTGESAGNIEKFKESIFAIGAQQPGASIADLTDIALTGAKAGVDPGRLDQFTASMAKVKNALGDKEGLNTSQMTEQMSRMLNLFGKGTDYVESFGSGLVRMANVSTASAAGILDVSMGLSGTFASMGMLIPQTMAFSSVIADAGLKNQMAAGAFNQILRTLASDSGKMARQIGVPIDEFQNLVRTDAMGALELLLRKFNEINAADPIKAQEFISSLGFRGVRTGAALQQVATMVDEVKKRTAMAVEEERTHGALLAASSLGAEKSSAGIGKLKNAFVELGDAIGKNVIGPLSALAGAAAPAVRSVAGALKGKHYVRLDDGTIAERTNQNSFTGPLGLTMRPDVTPTPEEQKTLDAADKVKEDAKAKRAADDKAWEDAKKMKPPPAPPRPADLRAAHEAGVAAVAAENEARRAAEAERQRTRFLPTAADRARALEEVGPAKENAKGDVSARDQKEHDEAVFRHAQRIQAERQEGTGSIEEKARELGKDIERIGKMALGTLFAQPAQKFGIAAGLAETGIGKVAGAAGNPLAGVADTLKGLALDPDAPKKKAFRSETFRDPADFARSAIQTAMSDKEDKAEKMVKAQEDGNKKLDDIHKALTTDKPGAKNRRTTMTGRA